ncbi:SMAD/FHA domain [Phytophthora cinnamomi]|uniref:SMAD/FHA domain n=1 Tax=Phytophthora cinnamomi TaxID=4785 RepID=UPI003559D390|nr:SMAD/FHA domain [Phytophthora cinnamomi]
MELIEEKDQELEKLKRQQRAEALEQAAAKSQWENDLHRFFESAVVKIAQASDQLEALLQRAEDDVLAARFGAAQFLVDCMLQQKILNADEWVRLQLSTSPGDKAPPSSDPIEDPVADLSSNGRFLYDMIQQVTN